MTSPIISPDTPQLKRCSKCGELKPRTAFFRQSAKPDGLRCQCKACIRAYTAAYAEQRVEYDRKYRAANHERIAEQKRAYYASNADYRIANAERKREHYAANRERFAERGRAYRQTDAGKAARRASNHNRRARKAGAGGAYTTADLAAIRAAQTDKRGRLICWRCGKPIKDTPHLDHWIPLDKGGTNDAGNLHYMHARCNLTKNAKHPAELGRLI